MAASVVHIPLAPMTLEINAAQSEYVTWVYRWKNVDLSADFETYSQNFGHPDGWVWRMLFQQNVDAAGNRVYGIFLYVVMTDNELQERTWKRDIRYLQFVIQNADGRQLKDKTTVALYKEQQMSWGFPNLLDNSILLRDPVVNTRRTIDIVCRMRYHPNQEKLRRPLSPSVPGLLGSSMGALQGSPRDWEQKTGPTPVVDPVGKHLKKLLNNRDFSDLEIIVGPERQVMYAHKCILAARSDWFRSALRPGGFIEARENRIKLVEDDPKIFEALLEFLYTGDYPLASLETVPLPIVNPLRSLSTSSKRPETLHFSPRSPPSIPPRNLIDDTATSVQSFNADQSTDDFFGRASSEAGGAAVETDPDYDSSDEQKFALFLMADKYGVTELKTLIRLHLTTELLDTSTNHPPGQRLIKLIRFAFEELPESTRTNSRQSVRDSGLGGSERGHISPPAGLPYGHAFGTGTVNYGLDNLHNQTASASIFSHASEQDVAVAMTSDQQQQQQRGLSRLRDHQSEQYNVYGRDNETQMLREGIAMFVAKMFQLVRQIEGFEDLLREGGDMGGFVKMVMDNMYRP
ncbi:POZ domain-containing protein [Ascodesmis nigricans]|uniref:POZ domain-containing protein n=1 Tax=Ascodesmis nigricans TaxID=341454 RepID=A0A4S2MQ54_9PEZI|nr:POZ domain-containing protein [Ascodesmis nigricans]